MTEKATQVWLLLLILFTPLISVAYAFVYSQESLQISQMIISVNHGVKTVQVTGSIPNEMDSQQFGFFSALFWNPTSSIYQISQVEFNATNAINQVLNGVEQGSGKSYPTSGWILDKGKKVVYLMTAIVVPPHTAQEFFIKIKGNGKSENFSMAIRIMANSTMYQKSYQTKFKGDSTLSVLWLGSRSTPQLVVSALQGQETTFYISLQEDANKVPIGSDGKLTIQLPQEFTDIQDIGGAGWSPATILGNKIEVNNIMPVKGSYITYAFKTRTPTYKGLYMLNASFNGTPKENPIGNFCIRITDGS